MSWGATDDVAEAQAYEEDAHLDSMHQTELAVLRFVHAPVQKLPFEEEQLGLATGLAPIVCWGFARAAEG